MKRGSTNFLRFVILLMGTGVLALCIFALPEMWRGGSKEFPMASYAVFLIMIGLYATVIPFFVALWQTLKLLNYIDQNKAFSDLSVKALRSIKCCAIIIAVLYIGGVPLLFPIADADDAPGLIIIGMAIACAPIAIAVLAAILQRLLQDAIDMKSENDLTV
ncbi:DUF2975 domain-containing protein [Candidatus Falkowbacteria bacterium]|nr:DUF2975 domain-containing protein [Candidatus Falkowbacteria bacterium]